MKTLLTKLMVNDLGVDPNEWFETPKSDEPLPVVITDEYAPCDVEYDLENPDESGLVENVAFFVTNDVTANFRVVLTRSELRTVSATEIERMWRDEVGLLPDVRKQKYSSGTRYKINSRMG